MIYTGCTAITVNCNLPENNGKIVTVGVRLGLGKDIWPFALDARFSVWWEIDKPIKQVIEHVETKMKMTEIIYCLPEYNLQKIDEDFEDDFAEESEDLFERIEK